MLNWHALSFKRDNTNKQQDPNDINLKVELWYQDLEHKNLWHSEEGLVINTPALLEREPYYQLVCISRQGIVFEATELEMSRFT